MSAAWRRPSTANPDAELGPGEERRTRKGGESVPERRRLVDGHASQRRSNVAGMAATDAGARRQLLDAVAAAIDELGLAIASLGEAYDHLDDRTAERLEEDLFRPVQSAYGRAQRTYAEFAGRHGLPGARFEPRSVPVANRGAREPIDDAVAAVRAADDRLSELQDSLLPVEFGDLELRAGLTEVRRLLGDIPGKAREVVRTLGR